MAAERGDDAGDLRWFFCEASGAVTGLAALPIEPSPGGGSRSPASYCPDDRAIREVARERLIRSTLLLVPRGERGVLALYFGPPVRWRAFGEFRDVAGLVEYTAAALERAHRLAAELHRPTTPREAVERATRPNTRDVKFLRTVRDQAKALIAHALTEYRAAAKRYDRAQSDELKQWAGVRFGRS